MEAAGLGPISSYAFDWAKVCRREMKRLSRRLLLSPWTKTPDVLGELRACPGELRTHGRRIVKHLQPCGTQAYLVQYLFYRVHPVPAFVVTFELMTIAGQASRDKDPVSSRLKSVQKMQDINPSGAGHSKDTDIGRILDSHVSGQVGSGVRAPLATES